MNDDPSSVLREVLDHLLAVRTKTRHRGDRFYPGLERVVMSQAVRAGLLLSQIHCAIGHQSSSLRPWQRHEPLCAFLDDEIWPTDQIVLEDLSFAKLAIQMLSEAQRQELEAALAE